MDAEEASRRNLEPLGIFHSMAVTGCAPEEMGIGPVAAVTKLLNHHGLGVNDIDLWELNEALLLRRFTAATPQALIRNVSTPTAERSPSVTPMA